MTTYQTDPAAAALHATGWIPWQGLEITAAPLVDTNTGLFARLTYRGAMTAGKLLGGRLLTQREHDAVWETGHRLVPVLLTPGDHMASLQWATEHDAKMQIQIDASGWDGKRPLANAGKQWVAGAAPHRAINYGWWDTRAPNGRMWQSMGGAHDNGHHDYSQLTMLVRGSKGIVDTTAPRQGAALARSTIREGSTGSDVDAWQAVVGVAVDGTFGPASKKATQAWQSRAGLVPDGIVGARSWIAAGHVPVMAAQVPAGGESKACRAALRDANKRWPTRKRISDGIMGDARHQASKSDHNSGLAVDITHDPGAGCAGDVISDAACGDPRVTYVIWDRRIYNRARAAEGWRDYHGSNGHTHHCHISVRAEARDDDSPWPWAAKVQA